MAESPSRLAKSASAASAPRERARAVVATPASGELGAALGSLAAGGGNRAVSGLLTGGTPLPPQVLADMESRFGQSFSDVRIHDDAQAHASAARMHAKAYTHGYDIVFSANRFAPHAGPGKRLLAHELAHVVQQRRGGSAPASDSLGEHEVSARQAADGVMQGNAPIAVQGSTGIGVAREAEDGGVRGFMLERAKRALADALISSIGLPPAGTRLAAAVARGMGEQMAHELINDGKGAILLGHVAAMGPADVAQLVKGYYVGLVEGLVSPVTDLFGLAVFGERMEGMAEDLALSAFGARSELVTDLRSLLGEAATVKKSLRKVWGKVKEDPVAALNTLLSLPDAIGDLAEKKAYQLGKQGGSSIVASIEAPWSKDKKEEEPKPSLVTSPFAWVESKAKSAEDWVLDTPWSQIGSKAGYAIGFVAIQVVLFAFTEGIGNAIEEVGVALGKVGNALGRLSKLVGTAAGRVAELVTAVGKGIAFVEEAIALLAGKALKPLEKFLEPILEPLGNFFKSLRTFLRRLFGVAEKEGTQIVDAAAGKAGSLADDSTKLAPKPGEPLHPGPDVHGPAAKPKAGASDAGAATAEKKFGANKPAAKSETPEPKKTSGTSSGKGQSKTPGAGETEGSAKPPAKKAQTAKKQGGEGKKVAGKGSDSSAGAAPKKKAVGTGQPKPKRPQKTDVAKKTLDERIADAEQDLQASRTKTRDYFDERAKAGRSRKGGPKKGIDNAKERIWMLKRQKAYPKRQILENCEIKGMRGPDGKFKATPKIAGAGREPDFIEIDNGKAMMGELKSEWEFDKSLAGGPGTAKGGKTSVAGSSKMGGQFDAEDKVLNAARNAKGKVVVSGYDLRTGKPVELEFAPDQIDRGIFSSTAGWGPGTEWTN